MRIQTVREFNHLPSDARVMYKYRVFWVEYADGTRIEDDNVNQELFTVLEKCGWGIQFDRYIASHNVFGVYKHAPFDAIGLSTRMKSVADRLRGANLKSYRATVDSCKEHGVEVRNSYYRLRGGYWGQDHDRKALILDGFKYPYFYPSNLRYIPEDLDNWSQTILDAVNGKIPEKKKPEFSL